MHTYGMNPNAAADPHSVIQGDNYRFTVLNEHVLRMEYSSSGTFVDQETQIVLNRRFPVPEFTVNDSIDKLEIKTKYLILTYDKKPFSGNGLTVQVIGNPYQAFINHVKNCGYDCCHHRPLQNDFFCPLPDIVHPADPDHLIFRFQLFIDAFCLGHLGDDSFHSLSAGLVDLG